MEALTISNSTVGIAGHAHVTVGGDLNVNGSTQESYTELAVPRALQVFQGRQDVIQTLDILYFSEEPRKRKVVVCGSAGYGKTELAKKYANHLETSGIIKKSFWVVAESTDNLNKNFESLKKAYDTFKDELCLFVFDNGESRRGLSKYLPPDTPNALVLITSQVQDWGDDVVRVELEPVTRGTSLAIFKNILVDRYKRISEEQIIEIVKFVDGIPLGLMVIAGDLRREMDAQGSKFDIQCYKKEICSQSTLDKTIDYAMESPYEKSLRTAIHSMMNRMIQRLSAEENNFTNKILCVCAHLNPDRISMNDVKVILSEVGVDDRTIARCAHILKTFSFIFHQMSTDEESYYHIHRTCQDILRKYYDRKNKKLKEECYSACVMWVLQENPYARSGHRAAIFMNADENKTIVNKILRDYYSFVNIYLPKFFKSSRRKYFIIKDMLQHLASYGCYECLSLFFSDKGLITRKLILKKIQLLHKVAGVTLGNPKDTVRLLVAAGSDVHAADVYGQTALHVAALRGNTDTVRVLLQAGSDVHAANVLGQTALHEAARGGSTDTVRVLMQAGSDVHAVDSNGQTALHVAALYGPTDTVRVLIEAGSDVHAANESGRTTLHLAAEDGHTDTVRVLIAAGSDVHAADVYGQTALHVAAWTGSTDTVRVLLQAGSDVYAVDGNGQTALYRAAWGGCTDTVRVLLQAGSDVHAADDDGRTALHRAAWGGCTGTVRVLLQAGSDVHAVDGDAQTALHLAVWHGDIVHLLRSYGSTL